MKKITKKKIQRKMHLIKEDIHDLFTDGEIKEDLIIISMISGYAFFVAFILFYFAGFSLWDTLMYSFSTAIGIFAGLFASTFLIIVIDDIFFQD